MKRLTIIAAAMLTATPAAGQTSPYAAEAPRAIAALSDEEVTQLLDGAGMRYALAAELNGVPGPRHALDLADSLHLDDAQRERIREVFDHMQTEARRLGTEIVRRERELNALFASGEARTADVEPQTLELGRLYGRLRAVHLNAHIETAALMHRPQIARYAALRGYVDSAAPATGEHGAHH